MVHLNSRDSSIDVSSLISIVMPLYNASSYVKESILSVISQTYTNWELIMVDDNSTDDTLLVIEPYIILDNRIKLIKLSSNLGAAEARNTAILRATGKYISFLDSDDVWMPQKLEVQVDFMERNKISFSFMSYFKINSNGKNIGCVNVPDVVSYNDLLRTCSIGCLTAMFNADILGKQTMPLLRKRQDYGLWLKLIKLSEKAYGIDHPLASYRVHSDSISSNKLSAAKYQWRIYREVEQLSFLNSSFNFFTYIFYGALKTKMPKVYSYFIK